MPGAIDTGTRIDRLCSALIVANLDQTFVCATVWTRNRFRSCATGAEVEDIDCLVTS